MLKVMIFLFLSLVSISVVAMEGTSKKHVEVANIAPWAAAKKMITILSVNNTYYPSIFDNTTVSRIKELAANSERISIDQLQLYPKIKQDLFFTQNGPELDDSNLIKEVMSYYNTDTFELVVKNTSEVNDQ